MIDNFPIFQKELLEQSIRKRTYIIRTCFGMLFFGFFLASWHNWNVYSLYGNNFGHGRFLVQEIFVCQFVSIFLLVPPIMASAIAYERERGSLHLLLLSTLTEREIIFEKLLGRLVPIFSLLFISVPPLAISYSLGGVSSKTIFYGLAMAFLCVLEVSTIAIVFSCCCATITQTLVASYIFGFCFYMFVPLCDYLVNGYSSDGSYFLFPAYFIFYKFDDTSWTTIIFDLVALIFFTCFFFKMAVFCLTKNIVIPVSNWLRKLFSRIDAVLKRYNQKFGNIELLSKYNSELPQQRPIYWREITTKSMGKFNYQLRIFLALQISTIAFIVFCALAFRFREAREIITGFYLVLYAISAVAISIFSANLIASEKAKQTFSVLLTTPMSTKEIILQKITSLNRVVWVLVLPLFSAIIFRYFYFYKSYGAKSPVFQTLSSFFYILLHLFTLRWIMLWVGLNIKRKVFATVWVIAIAVVWWLGPLFLSDLLRSFFSRSTRDFIAFFSPLAPLAILEKKSYLNIVNYKYPYFLFCLGSHLGLYVFFRKRCLQYSHYRFEKK